MYIIDVSPDMDTAKNNFDMEQIKQKAIFFGKIDNLTQYKK